MLEQCRMADESLVSLLKDGVETWNKWRSEGQRGLPDLSGANLCGAKLSLANLRGADLSGAKLSEANLGEADLSGSMLSEAKLWRADLSRANLDGVVLNRANLRESNLSRAGLSKAELIRADLRQADLRQANLGGSNLSGATLRRTLLDGTNFERATVGATIFADIDLSSCRGLESVRHRGKSTLGVDSIARSKGQIPKIFLREVGLPNTDEWISYISSSVSDAIQFYSCFISYSNKDKAFATRLYDALQSKGVICYYDEE